VLGKEKQSGQRLKHILLAVTGGIAAYKAA